MIGHELRNPLAALVLSAGLISETIDELDRDELGNLLMSLQSRAHGLQVLVENLMQQSAGGKIKLNVEPLTIDELVADVRLTVEPLLARNRQTLHVRGTAHTLLADRARLAQVLVNLIANASKFSRPDTTIELEFQQDESLLWCAVADRGIGLPSGSTAWLFEPAARADHTSSGLGLGLAIVKSIVETHGGCVGAANRADGGARFWFTLPRVNEPAPRADSLTQRTGSGFATRS